MNESKDKKLRTGNAKNSYSINPIEFNRVLEVFFSETGRADVSLGALWAFLWVARHQGNTQQELTDAMRRYFAMSKQSVSRHMALLGPGLKIQGEYKEGFHWVDSVEDRMNRRTKVLYLTDEGSRVFTRMFKGG
jgi:DNA-binding MarR family transcriptional regulator